MEHDMPSKYTTTILTKTINNYNQKDGESDDSQNMIYNTIFPRR
jgi:hypothetical protein